MNSVEFLYENGPCLVVAKPCGLLTQAPRGIDSLEVRVKQYLKLRDRNPGNVYLGVPHRLDRPASGAVVLARHVRAARRISEQFEARTVEKIYWTLVAGSLSHEQGTWTDFVRKIPGEARAEIVERQHPDARWARLDYQVLMCWGEVSWLEIRLGTGRNHQIRIQAASRGHCVLGDDQYGSQIPFGPSQPDPRDRSIALHARCLRFRHPMSQEPVEVTAPLPPEWEESVKV